MNATGREQLKQATRLLVVQLGGLEAAASLTSVGKSQLSQYQLSHAEMTAPIGVVADLEAALGEPVVTRTLARLAGCDLVPSGAAPAPVQPLEIVADLQAGLGRLAESVLAMERDGVRSHAEIEECRRVTQAIVEAAGRALEKLCALQAGRPHLAAVGGGAA
jgi:LmbE family N-acetylglucosaminyl deacetylase